MNYTANVGQFLCYCVLTAFQKNNRIRGVLIGIHYGKGIISGKQAASMCTYDY